MQGIFSQNLWLVPLYTLSGMALSSLWSPNIIKQAGGPRPAGYLNILMTLLAFSHALLAFPETVKQGAQYLSFGWLNAPGLHITLDLEISSLTVGALILVTGLNLVAQIYAIGYLEMDWGWARFFALLGLFESGMCTLVLCNSLFFSYVVLEILTLGTYLLLGFWFNQSLVVTGARDAFLTKRIGDLVLLMGVVALLPLAGTWNYNELAQWAATAKINPNVANLLCLSLLAGPLGKCAQFPLHLWLDEAMEGPAPATILRNTVVVSTGAWVMIKLQPVFALSPLTMNVMIAIGAATAVGAAAIAIAQIDVKRSLSYSVSAYMGLIFIAVGTGQVQAALTLLLTYAISMSLLVTTVGGIIWNNITQDLTQYGGLWSRRPVSAICFLVGATSLVALPPLGGFWVLNQMADNLSATHPGLFGVLLVVNSLTAFSVTREFTLIFCGKPKPMTVRSPEALWPLVLPMMILMGFALHMPLIFAKWHLLPDWETINLPVAISLVASTLISSIAAAYIYLSDNVAKPVRFGPQAVQDFFAYDLYTAQLYKVTVVAIVGLVSEVVYWIDKFIVDGLVNLVGWVTVVGGNSLKYNVSGQTQFYVLSILLGVALIGFFICWPWLSQISLVFGTTGIGNLLQVIN